MYAYSAQCIGVNAFRAVSNRQDALSRQSLLLAPRPAPPPPCHALPAPHRSPALPCAAATRHIVKEWQKKVLGGPAAWSGGSGKENSFSGELGCGS
jgi:hypothetical protein